MRRRRRTTPSGASPRARPGRFSPSPRTFSPKPLVIRGENMSPSVNAIATLTFRVRRDEESDGSAVTRW